MVATTKKRITAPAMVSVSVISRGAHKLLLTSCEEVELAPAGVGQSFSPIWLSLIVTAHA